MNIPVFVLCVNLICFDIETNQRNNIIEFASFYQNITEFPDISLNRHVIENLRNDLPKYINNTTSNYYLTKVIELFQVFIQGYFQLFTKIFIFIVINILMFSLLIIRW